MKKSNSHLSRTSQSPLSQRIILANKLYVPQRLVEQEELTRWTYNWIDTITEEKLDEYGLVVLNENGEAETVRTEIERQLSSHSRIYTGIKNYYAFPRGNPQKINSYLKENDVIDIRSTQPWDFQLKLNKSTTKDKRWPEQLRCINAWFKKGYGIIQGDTGSGKTVIGVGLACKLGVRTLILSTRRDAFKQWEREFRQHTNLDRLEKEYEKQLLGEYRSSKKKSIFPITIATVQSFLRKKGRKRLAGIQDEFALVMVDEAHEVCTEEHSKPVMLFNPATIVGLTATPERADNRHKLLFDMVGPVIVRSKTVQMPPRVTFIKTGIEAPPWLYNTKKPYSREYKWVMTLSSLANSEPRTELILRWLIEDIKRGRKIAAYSERTQIIQKLRERLRGEGYDVGYVDGTIKNRDPIYEAFRKGKYDVLCAGKVLNALVNLPEMDCLHVCTPVNKQSVITQIYGRARRSSEGKTNTEIRYYADEKGQLTGAYNNNRKVCKSMGWEILDDDSVISAGMKRWKHPSKRLFKKNG